MAPLECGCSSTPSKLPPHDAAQQVVPRHMPQFVCNTVQRQQSSRHYALPHKETVTDGTACGRPALRSLLCHSVAARADAATGSARQTPHILRPLDAAVCL
jgi:hypothetical protein